MSIVGSMVIPWTRVRLDSLEARTYLRWRWKSPRTPSVQSCSCVMDFKLTDVGASSAVCSPVAADHLSEKWDHGTKISWKFSVGSTVMSALNEANWHLYTLMRASQNATLKAVTLPPTLRTPRARPSIDEASGNLAKTGLVVRAMVKPGAWSDGTVRQTPW